MFPVLIGLLYFLGAWVGVHFAALESGIVILWPPNAFLLAALLSQPPRRWWPLLVVVLAAEIAADVPVFTVTQALLFGAINIMECLFAASLIRFCLGREVDWEAPKDLSLFLVIVFFIASPVAALGGASVYSFLLSSDTPFLTFWRLWWIGDATGLIILTPILHMVFSASLLQRMASVTWPHRLELSGAWAFSLIACYAIFLLDLDSRDYLALTPLLVVAAPVWVAIRFGPLAGSSLATAVALFVAFATASGMGPFVREQQDQSALLTQEFTMLFTIIVLFVAAFVHQNRQKSGKLRQALEEFRKLNQDLEERVRKRTQELFDANQKLENLALTDELTGIANRRRMKALGEEESQRSERSERPFSVILMDLDYFKQVNDRYGHAIGDQCLQAFVRTIAPSLRSKDRFGRWGGEEFMILVPDSDQVDLVRLSEKLLSCTRGLVVPVEEHHINITVSIGVAEWHQVSFDELVSEADNALYRAKAHGRDRAEFSVRMQHLVQ